MNVPGSSAYNTLTSVLRLDHVEFGVHVLSNVANERQDFANALNHN